MVFEKLTTTSGAELIDEIQRYLELVDALRAAGREPNWRRDLDPQDDGPDMEHRLATSTGLGAGPGPQRFTV